MSTARRWRKRLFRGGIALLVLGLITALAAAVLHRIYVVDNPGDHLDEAHILSLIARESKVTYRDGETTIGAFFEEEHRLYVHYDEIPEAWVDAIVSSEDQRYFEHPGVDLEGLARAMIQNVKAGRVVSGGSTLTMQTSENLFHPGTRDLKGKYWEVLDTLRLEAHYSKEQILEFYANQFHVYGNGRGLGVAARYFFDKEVSELTLQESAFLAGLVKIPGRYNPFIGDSEEKRSAAAAKALTRTEYVLGRMLVDGKISQAEHDALIGVPIPFRKGDFRYDRNIVMDEVARQLERAPFPELLMAAGIDNPSTAGMTIVTTLDEEVQRGTTYGLWHHLSSAGTSLEGFSAQDFLHPERLAPKPDPNAPPVPFAFRYARIEGTEGGEVRLDLGGFEGRLDKEALDRAATMLAVAGSGDRYTKPSATVRGALDTALAKDRVVWVSVRAPRGEVWLCDLEVRPELQGAAVVLEEGRIRAMVGGNDNRNFNRAVSAKRQLGSTWKMLVYNAALQLGWTPTDTLDNRRSVFPFTGTWYYPRPDHRSEDFVSIAWAGVRSENLATIWLLYHLTDRLNPEQVRRLAQLTGLAQRTDESYDAYVVRIRDTHGVVSTRDRLDSALFGAVKGEVIAELAFTGHPEDAAELRSLHYGRGFSAERQRVETMGGGGEKTARLRAVDQNFLWLEQQGELCGVQHLRLREAEAPLDPRMVDRLHVRLTPRGFEVACGQVPEGFVPASEDLALRLGSEGVPPISPDVLVDDRLHLSTLRAVRKAMVRLRPELEAVDPYAPEVLYLHPDFRLTLGMRYVAGLAEALGVDSELPPVLSMPLGAVDVSLVEMANVYQGFLGGEAWSYPGRGYEPGAVPGLRASFEVPEQRVSALLIQEIRDREGNVLYKAEPEPERVADPVAGALTTDILQNVVRHGTGQRALAVAGGLPLGGKTGTTNDFKNAAFLGHVPRAEGKTIPVASAFTVAAYVGYDDNRPMVRGNIRLQGASGALPVWMGAVVALREAGLTPPGQPEEVEGAHRVGVLKDSGLPDPRQESEPERSVLVYGDQAGMRRFAPFAEKAQEAEAVEEALPSGSIDTGAEATIDPRLGPEPAEPSIWDGITPPPGG